MKLHNVIIAVLSLVIVVSLVSCSLYKFKVTDEMENLRATITELDYVSDLNYSMKGQPNSSYSKFSIIVVFENEEMMNLHGEDILFEIFHYFSDNQQVTDDLRNIGALVYGIDYTYVSSDENVYYASYERNEGSINTWSVNNTYYVTIEENGYYKYPKDSSDPVEDREFVEWGV